MATHRYRNRDITGEEILFIRQRSSQIIPELSRWKLSRGAMAEAWQWKQTNGALRDMVCRGLLLMLASRGQIELPPVRSAWCRNRIAEPGKKPEPVIPDNFGRCAGHFTASPRWSLCKCGARPEELLFNSLVEQ